MAACDDGSSGGAVALNSVTADGSPAQTTTTLTLTFNAAITGLTAGDITLSGVSGVIKGVLSGYGPSYTLPIRGFTTDETLTVAVAKSGYTITGSPKTVDIYYYSGGTSSLIKMASVPGGSFQMGSNNSLDWGASPPYTVTLTSFQMSKYPVKQVQYQAVMGTDPSHFSSSPASGEVQWNRPVEQVSWYDAIEFCNALSVQEGLSPYYTIDKINQDPNNMNPYDTLKWTVTLNSTANGYRLPTEAQWEYAAKGGNSPGNYTYAGSNDIDTVAWYTSNSGNKTHEVGKKAANALGLYDMSGNVCEWCWDWYGSYIADNTADPSGPVFGASRVRRGGSWDDSAEYARSAYRDYYNPYGRNVYTGFRLVRP